MPKDMFGDEVGDSSPPISGRQPGAATAWTQPDEASPVASSQSARGGWADGGREGDGVPRPSAGTRTSPLGPPLHLLGVAAICVVASLLLGLVGHARPELALGGWVLGGFAAIGFLALFTLRDALRRSDAWYTQNTAAAKLRGGLVILAVAVVALNAYQFADWAARR